jgi:diacylglycerol O-acyltransferase
MQRMSGIDPMFVYSQTPEAPMEVAYACVFDPATAPGGYSFEAVRQVLSVRVPTMVPFRRRLIEVPMGLDHPRWVDDPEFDLDNHLHRVALPAPGGPGELTDLVATVMGRPLAIDQPPWEMHVVEGLADGRVGLIAKVHHAVIDGVAGAQLLAQLLDLVPEGRPASDFITPEPAGKLPSRAQLVSHALPSVVTGPIRSFRALREIGRTAVRLAVHASDRSAGPLSVPLGAPTTFEAPMTADRTVSFAELDLEQVLKLKEHFGVTLNDVVMTICSGALRAHLTDHDQAVEGQLVAIVPVSVRGTPEDGALGNRLSAMFVPLANDLELPLERLEATAASCNCTKAQERAVGFGPLASALSDAVPPALARPFMRMGARSGLVRRLGAGNLMISNVPGPTFPLYFAGMRMEAVHPLGPVVHGVSLNITVQTYLESLFVGINACAVGVPDLAGLAEALVAELDELSLAAGTYRHQADDLEAEVEVVEVEEVEVEEVDVGAEAEFDLEFALELAMDSEDESEARQEVVKLHLVHSGPGVAEWTLRNEQMGRTPHWSLLMLPA